MKTPASIILALIFPLLAMTQQNYKIIKLRTLDDRTIDLGDIFQHNDLTMVYFFNESCRNLTDQFDYMENLAGEYSEINLKIIAVYNTSDCNYSRIKPLISGNDIGIETLIDTNGEVQRAMGLPVNSTVILTRYNNLPSGDYKQSVSYSPEQAEMELTQLLSADNHGSYSNSSFSHNLSAEYK